jgi:hypothetical protein
MPCDKPVQIIRRTGYSPSPSCNTPSYIENPWKQSLFGKVPVQFRAPNGLVDRSSHFDRCWRVYDECGYMVQGGGVGQSGRSMSIKVSSGERISAQQGVLFSFFCRWSSTGASRVRAAFQNGMMKSFPGYFFLPAVDNKMPFLVAGHGRSRVRCKQP